MSIGFGGGLGRSEFGPVHLCRPWRCRTAIGSEGGIVTALGIHCSDSVT